VLKNVDLNRLRYFERVYSSQSLLEAAHDLSVTSSAVNQAIRVLEDEIGVQLFLRTGKKYVPTNEAREFYAAILPLIVGVEESVNRIRRQRHEVEGRIRIGTISEFGIRSTLPALAKFRELNPRTEFQVTLLGTTELLKQLLENKLDMAIVDDSSGVRLFEKQIVFREISDEILLMVCSTGYYKRKVPRGHLGWKQLRNLEHVPYHKGEEGVSKWYRHHFGRVPDIRATLYADSVRGVLKGVQLGFGLGVLPFLLIEDEIKKGKLKVLDTQKKPLVNGIVLAQSADRIPNHLEKTFADFLAKELQKKDHVSRKFD